MDDIKVVIEGKTELVPNNTSLFDLSKKYQKNHKKEIILAKVNGSYKELFHRVHGECNIEFCDYSDTYANRCYVNGLIFLLYYTVHKKFKDKVLMKVLHSIDKGIYIELSKDIDEIILDDIKNEMQKYVKEDLLFLKANVDRLEAIDYFKKRGNESKAELLRYNTNTHITLYKLDDIYEYLYTLMPNRTGVLKEFDLCYLNNRGFILQFPTCFMESILPYNHHSQMFDVFNNFRSWKELMHLDNVVDLNKKVSSGKISDIIRIDEVLQSNRLLELAKIINEKRDKVKIVLLSGPSSSGKTTTCRKLSMYLQSFGMNPVSISMDDYFLDREDTPLDEFGKPDFESLAAIDLELFDEQMKALLNHEKVTVPTFNFITGSKEFKNSLQLSENDILLIEGIHGLNPELLKNIKPENKFKIYLSPLIELNIDNLSKVSTVDHRLLRRIVRDNRTRGYPVDKTLAVWADVRRGEEKYIFPCQDFSDYTFNTALSYEIGVLKTYVEPLLYSVDVNSEYYDEAKRLIDFLRNFLVIPADDVPSDSILREFIGHSCFHEEEN